VPVIACNVFQVTIPGRKECFRLYGREGYPLVDLMLRSEERTPQVHQGLALQYCEPCQAILTQAAAFMLAQLAEMLAQEVASTPFPSGGSDVTPFPSGRK